MALCLSVCLSFVCVHHKSVFYQKGWTDRAGFWHECFFRPVSECVATNSGIYKKGTFPELRPKLGLAKFCHDTSILEMIDQLSSTKVDARA